MITLNSAQLTVDLLPDKGADVHSIVDRATGIDVLFKTPWGGAKAAPPGANSEVGWLARYPGGWQQLLPNAGPARLQDGVELGYHGEAAVVPWTVVEAAPERARLVVELFTSPLRLERTVRVDGGRLSIQDVVRNLGPDPVGVRWVQHPAFGAPFIDGRCTIDTSARSFLSDADIPGTGLDPDVLTPFPSLPGVVGRDLRDVAGADEARAVFGALTDFAGQAWYSISSPSVGFGIRMEWDAAVFPHAWFWQECHDSPSFPWFRRAYAVAVEPANILPGEGQSGDLRRGDTPLLAAGASWVSELSMSRFDF